MQCRHNGLITSATRWLRRRVQMKLRCLVTACALRRRHAVLMLKQALRVLLILIERGSHRGVGSERLL